VRARGPQNAGAQVQGEKGAAKDGPFKAC
jgi:hypothetical protein